MELLSRDPASAGRALPPRGRRTRVRRPARPGRPPRFSPRRGGRLGRAGRARTRRRDAPDERTGRSAAIAGLAVHRMAKRFIVGADPADAVPDARAPCGSDGAAASVDLLGEATVTAAEADRYARRCDDALRTLAHAAAPWPAPALERTRRRRPARQPVGQGHRAHRRSVRAEAPERGHRGRQAPGSGPAAHGAARSARTCTSTWSRWTRASLITELVIELLTEPEFARRPVAPGIVLQAYLQRRRRAARPPARLGGAAAHARSRSGSSRAPTGTTRPSRPRQHGWTPPVFEAKAESDRSFERLTRRLIDARPQRPRRRSPRTTCARSPTRSPTRLAAATATSSSRCCAASATTCRTRSPAWACACAPTARSATSSPAWPTSCAACSRTPPTTRSSPAARGGADLDALLRRAMTSFINEPLLELRRAPVRERAGRRARRARRAAAAGACR